MSNYNFVGVVVVGRGCWQFPPLSNHSCFWGCYLGVAVLASLGSGHLDDLAGTSSQHHVAVLAQGGTLHGIGGGGARLAACEVKIGICHDALTQERCRRHSGFTLSWGRRGGGGQNGNQLVHTEIRGSAN